jgi:hypothetical protein
VRPTTYGPFASKAECEQAKERADWQGWHTVPGNDARAPGIAPSQAARAAPGRDVAMAGAPGRRADGGDDRDRAELVDLMVRTGWLAPRECHERRDRPRSYGHDRGRCATRCSRWRDRPARKVTARLGRLPIRVACAPRASIQNDTGLSQGLAGSPCGRLEACRGDGAWNKWRYERIGGLPWLSRAT